MEGYFFAGAEEKTPLPFHGGAGKPGDGGSTRKGGNPKAEAEALLKLFPILKDKRKMRAGGISTGEQQLLTMGLALMQKPRFLLADEPTQGLSPAYVDIIFDKLLEINGTGTGILLVEHNARMTLEIAHRGYVFKIGGIFMEDSGQNLLASDEVKRVFLGG